VERHAGLAWKIVGVLLGAINGLIAYYMYDTNQDIQALRTSVENIRAEQTSRTNLFPELSGKMDGMKGQIEDLKDRVDRLERLLLRRRTNGDE